MINCVDGNMYSIIFVAAALALLVLFIFSVSEKRKCYEEWRNLKGARERARKINTKIFEIRYKKCRKNNRICNILVFLLVLLEIIMIFYKQKYTIKEEFAWTIEERQKAGSVTCEIIERTKDADMEWWEEAIHFPWFIDAFNVAEDNEARVDITAQGLAYYKDEVTNLFITPPIRKGEIKEPPKADADFAEDKAFYEHLVGSNKSGMEPDVLWKGFQAGKRVITYYNTSENVFQTGVLAENAHENAYATAMDDEMAIQYAAGITEQFEEFLEFEVPYIGGGKEVYKDEISFRIGKVMYRESKYGEQPTQVDEHCGIMAYEYFVYAVEETDIYAPSYLGYVYYSGLGCLNILSDAKDPVLRKQLCETELQRWAELEEEHGPSYCSMYNVENKSEQEILNVKETLERACK